MMDRETQRRLEGRRAAVYSLALAVLSACGLVLAALFLCDVLPSGEFLDESTCVNLAMLLALFGMWQYGKAEDKDTQDFWPKTFGLAINLPVAIISAWCVMVRVVELVKGLFA